MSLEVHIDWEGETHAIGRLHTADRSATVSFEYTTDWLRRPGAFAIDPTSLPLRAGVQHSATLFGAMQDCGPDRWGRLLIERAVRKQVLERKPYQDLDYVLALDDASRIGALRFRTNADGPFLASGNGKIPPLVQLSALLNSANAVHGETESAQDLRFLLGQGQRREARSHACRGDGEGQNGLHRTGQGPQWPAGSLRVAGRALGADADG